MKPTAVAARDALHRAAGPGRAVTALYREVSTLTPDVVLLDGRRSGRRAAAAPPGSVEAACSNRPRWRSTCTRCTRDTSAGLRARGASTVVDAAVERASRADGVWTVTMTDGRTVEAASGRQRRRRLGRPNRRAAGAAPVGLRALRRSAFMVDAPPDLAGPMVADIDDAFYIKRDAGKMLCSPADETPQEPGDARPDELEIARAIEVINEVTTLDVRHVRSSWAGLRNFVADRNPVVGFDPSVEGFFWFAGQGGYGIQISPALARTGASVAARRGAARRCGGAWAGRSRPLPRPLDARMGHRPARDH